VGYELYHRVISIRYFEGGPVQIAAQCGIARNPGATGVEELTAGLEVRARHLRPTVPERDEVRRDQHLVKAAPVPYYDRICLNSIPNRHQNRHHPGG
jgi:hypothetical protein